MISMKKQAILLALESGLLVYLVLKQYEVVLLEREVDWKEHWFVEYP